VAIRPGLRKLPGEADRPCRGRRVAPGWG
jgi:hypothetical protein